VKPTDKGKPAADSAAREEYADAPSLVAELIACDAYHPRQLVRRGHWQNVWHWLTRAALVGGGSMALVGLTGPFGVVVMAGLILPYASVLTMGSHLDQFRGDRVLRVGDQVDRWGLTAAQMWPVAFVYLLLSIAFMILAIMNRTDDAARLVALGGVAFLGLAWTESVAYRVLHHGEVADAVGVGLHQAGRRLSTYPMEVLRGLTFRRKDTGEGQLLSTWLRTGLGSLLWGLLIWNLVYFGSAGPAGLPSVAAEFLAFVVAGAATWHNFEAGAGIWVHHYLAYMAERRGLVAAARKALAETEAGATSGAGG
jgi:hypothetical protein